MESFSEFAQAKTLLLITPWKKNFASHSASLKAPSQISNKHWHEQGALFSWTFSAASRNLKRWLADKDAVVSVTK